MRKICKKLAVVAKVTFFAEKKQICPYILFDVKKIDEEDNGKIMYQIYFI